MAISTLYSATVFQLVTELKFWTDLPKKNLSMGPINKDRLADGLPALTETDPSLTALAQSAADKWVTVGKFFNPESTNMTS